MFREPSNSQRQLRWKLGCCILAPRSRPKPATTEFASMDSKPRQRRHARCLCFGFFLLAFLSLPCRAESPGGPSPNAKTKPQAQNAARASEAGAQSTPASESSEQALTEQYTLAHER